MSFSGIKLEFTIDQTNIANLKDKIEKGIAKEPYELKNITVDDKAVRALGASIATAINKYYKGNPQGGLAITSIKSTKKALNDLKSQIQDFVKNTTLTINDIKVAPISLEDIKITHANSLQKKINESIRAGQYSLEITSIDASKAIKGVREQLQASLEAAGFTGESTAAKRETAKMQNAVLSKKARQEKVNNLNNSLKEVKGAAAGDRSVKNSDLVAEKLKEIRSLIDQTTSVLDDFSESGVKAFNDVVAKPKKR